jgi:Cu/Zn superoxide dismutase
MKTKWGRRAATAVISGGLIVAGATVVVAAPWKVQSTGKLADLRTAVADGLEDATAHVKAEPVGPEQTLVKLKLTGIDHLQVGRRYGAHVHVGQCREGDGAAAGPHYNHAHGAVISDQTEVWLDFTVAQGGIADSEAVVPFFIEPGAAMSVVVHEQTTNGTTGAAGPRVACLPVDF